MAALGLQCCTGSSVVAKSTDYFPVVVLELLIKVASPVAEHGLQGSWVSAVVSRGLSSCGSGALEPRVNSYGPRV